VPPLLFETLLGTLEGSAKRAIDVLLTDQPHAVDPDTLGNSPGISRSSSPGATHSRK